MFCYQCQETAWQRGCEKRGVCGKPPAAADLMDQLVYLVKGIAFWGDQAAELDVPIRAAGRLVTHALFATITNANFDEADLEVLLLKAAAQRDELAAAVQAAHQSQRGAPWQGALPPMAVPSGAAGAAPAYDPAWVGVLATPDEDIRSLRELVIYGCKGISAYAHHAAVLDYEDDAIYAFLLRALAAVTRDLSADELTALTLETGHAAAQTMALLDRANTETYGTPEVTAVTLEPGQRPGILVSGHDLRDLRDLLEQTRDQGVDVYTHSEMLPAHGYPKLKAYPHLVGHYGGSWWHQDKEFATFNGAILMTTNCIVPVKDSYRDRIFTTGVVGYPGVPHIADRAPGGQKDFSAVIARAKQCAPPDPLEQGVVVTGCAHDQILALADKVVAAVKAGKIKRFIVMAGCDGRYRDREYYTQVAEQLPPDTVILTAGCAKYRYNKLNLGEIDGIPRVLDAGQCNDSYSLAVVALKLKDVFGVADVNELPISFDVAWYEQKAVAVLLALLALGFKGLRVGPTLPAFLSPNVAQVLITKFGLQGIATPEEDVAAMVAGR